MPYITQETVLRSNTVEGAITALYEGEEDACISWIVSAKGVHIDALDITDGEGPNMVISGADALALGQALMKAGTKACNLEITKTQAQAETIEF